MFKNTASQKLTVLAFADAGHATLDAGERVTGDQGNITLKVEQDDDTFRTASNDVNPTETEDGQYVFDLTAGETNGDKLTYYPESSTAGVQVVVFPSMVIYNKFRVCCGIWKFFAIKKNCLTCDNRSADYTCLLDDKEVDQLHGCERWTLRGLSVQR